MMHDKPLRRWPAVSVAATLLALLSGCANFTGFEVQTAESQSIAEDMALKRPDVSPSGWYAVNMRVAHNALKNKNYSAAVRIFRRLHDAMPERIEPILGLGDALFARKAYYKAAGAFRTALALKSDDRAARRGLGEALVHSGRVQDGIMHLERALPNGKDASLFNKIGVAHEIDGAPETAQAYFRSGLALHPNDIALRNNLALSLALSGSYSEAVSQLGRVLEHPAANQRHRLNLAFVHGMSGDFRAAGLSVGPFADGSYETIENERLSRIRSLALAGDRRQLLGMLNMPVPPASNLQISSEAIAAAEKPEEVRRAESAPGAAVDAPLSSEEYPPSFRATPPVTVAPIGLTEVAQDGPKSPTDAESMTNVSREINSLTDGNNLVNYNLTDAISEDVETAPILAPAELFSKNIDRKIPEKFALIAVDADAGMPVPDAHMPVTPEPKSENDDKKKPVKFVPVEADFDRNIPVKIEFRRNVLDADIPIIVTSSSEIVESDVPAVPEPSSEIVEIIMPVAIESGSEFSEASLPLTIASVSPDAREPDTAVTIPSMPTADPPESEISGDADFDPLGEGDNDQMAVIRKPVFEERDASNSRNEPDNATSVEQEENQITNFKQITLRPSKDLKMAKVDIGRNPVSAPVAVDQVGRQLAFSPSAGAGYRVQVGAYRNKSNAVRGKDMLTRMAPELLDRLETMVKTTNSTSSKAVNYRLRTASLSQADADNLCDNLKSKSIECLVIQHNDHLWNSA